MQHKDVLVIIPARGGSKRIIKKNIKEICGQPMIYWPLQVLTNIFFSNQILISTDDNEIINVVKKKGIEVPFIRPQELSDDYTGTMEVANHALKWFEKNVKIVDYVLIVYPTAVLLDKSDLELAYDILQDDKNCDYVFSGTTFPFPIQRAVYENKNGYASNFNPENYKKRSQDFKEVFHDAGQFYFCRTNSIRNSINFEDSNAKILKLKRNKVIDIDTEEDFEIAEEKMKLLGFLDKIYE